MITAYTWPPGLPCVLYEGKRQQIIDPKIGHQFASGRNRERRAYTAVPVLHEVRWVMHPWQAEEFERWFAHDLRDGTEWFYMELPLPQGKGPYPFRFRGSYEGPNPIGELWEITATLEQWLRAPDNNDGWPMNAGYGVRGYGL